MQLTCMAKIDDLWEDKVTQVAYGTGQIMAQSNHLLISNSGCLSNLVNSIMFLLVSLLIILSE